MMEDPFIYIPEMGLSLLHENKITIPTEFKVVEFDSTNPGINTDEGFEEIKKQFHLTEDDITEPFDETKGEIYGEQNKKTFKAVQIRVDNPIGLERKLRDEKGIEAFSGSPGRLTIRIA